MKVVIGKKDRFIGKKQVEWTFAFAFVLVLGGVIGAYSVNAAIPNPPLIVPVTQYSCEKGPTFVITVDNASTRNYYAIAGSGEPTVACGTLVYGGPANKGGATGTNAAQVIQGALNAVVNGTWLEFAPMNITGAIILAGSGIRLSGIAPGANGGINSQSKLQTTLFSNITLSAQSHNIGAIILENLAIYTLLFNSGTGAHTINTVTIQNVGIYRTVKTQGIVFAGTGTSYSNYISFKDDTMYDTMKTTEGATGMITVTNPSHSQGEFYFTNINYFTINPAGITAVLVQLQSGSIGAGMSFNQLYAVSVDSSSGSIMVNCSFAVSGELLGFDIVNSWFEPLKQMTLFSIMNSGSSVLLNANVQGNSFSTSSNVAILQNFAAIGIWQSNVESIMFQNNQFNTATPISIGIEGAVSGSSFRGVQVANNGPRFQPLDKITNAWTSTTVGLGGTKSMPGVSGGTYTLIGDSYGFTCTGGGTVTIAIKARDGATLISGLTCASAQINQFWPIYYQLTITNSSDFTGFVAYGA